MITYPFKVTEPQYDFLQLKERFKLFCAGFGAGKTECLLQHVFLDAIQYGNSSLVGVFAPTYDLIGLNIRPRLEDFLDKYGISYSLNKVENRFYCKGIGDIILRSLDNPKNLISYELVSGHIDELDTIAADKAQKAFNKILGRVRQVPKGFTESEIEHRVCVYTTPEGYEFAYKNWIKNPTSQHVLIQAPSYSNPELPKDYLDNLYELYTKELADAYIEGKFVPLTSGVVYSSFSREFNHSNETIQTNDTLYIGMDFNIDNMAATVFVRRGPEWHLVDYITKEHNTTTMANRIRMQWPDHKIRIYPDATGRSRQRAAQSSSESDIDILEERQYNFDVIYEKSNPFVRDRINAVNIGFDKRLVFVNTLNCEEIAEGLEQQPWKNAEPDKDHYADHANDSLGYVIAAEMPVKKPILNADVDFFTHTRLIR